MVSTNKSYPHLQSLCDCYTKYMPSHKNVTKLATKKYFTVGEVAYILGVTPLTLRNWDKAGKLRARRNPINNYRMYARSDVEFFLRRMEGGISSGDIV